MSKSRRFIVSLPFADIAITVRRNRRARPMLWYFLLSAAFHVLVVSTLVTVIARNLFPAVAQKPPPPEIVAISSAVRIEHRAHPVPAHNPLPKPRTVPMKRTVAARPQPVQRPVEKPAPPVHIRRELAKIAYNAPRSAPTPGSSLSQAQLRAQTQAFEQTIAQARAANDPVAGAATDNVAPGAPKRYALNIDGTIGMPQPEGILYPLKRWTNGLWVYYYVRYSAEYADGTTETGVVPWPIRFPINADPFARDRHRMPLPGPMPNYVASADVQMQPLVKNCYDHRYDYCPIEHE